MYHDFDQDQINRLINEGTAAQALLRDDAFANTMNDLDRLYLSLLVATPVGEDHRHTRDTHHAKLTVLREIVGEVTARAQALDAFHEWQSSRHDEKDYE